MEVIDPVVIERSCISAYGRIIFMLKRVTLNRNETVS